MPSGHDSSECAAVCDASGNTNVTIPRLGSFTNCTFVDYATSEPNYCGDREFPLEIEQGTACVDARNSEPQHPDLRVLLPLDLIVSKVS
jgi:hypothetical protein